MSMVSFQASQALAFAVADVAETLKARPGPCRLGFCWGGRMDGKWRLNVGFSKWGYGPTKKTAKILQSTKIEAKVQNHDKSR